jgi:hypothetical protein
LGFTFTVSGETRHDKTKMNGKKSASDRIIKEKEQPTFESIAKKLYLKPSDFSEVEKKELMTQLDNYLKYSFDDPSETRQKAFWDAVKFFVQNYSKIFDTGPFFEDIPGYPLSFIEASNKSRLLMSLNLLVNNPAKKEYRSSLLEDLSITNKALNSESNPWKEKFLQELDKEVETWAKKNLQPDFLPPSEHTKNTIKNFASSGWNHNGRHSDADRAKWARAAHGLFGLLTNAGANAYLELGHLDSGFATSRDHAAENFRMSTDPLAKGLCEYFGIRPATAIATLDGNLSQYVYPPRNISYANLWEALRLYSPEQLEKKAQEILSNSESKFRTGKIDSDVYVYFKKLAGFLFQLSEVQKTPPNYKLREVMLSKHLGLSSEEASLLAKAKPDEFLNIFSDIQSQNENISRNLAKKCRSLLSDVKSGYEAGAYKLVDFLFAYQINKDYGTPPKEKPVYDKLDLAIDILNSHRDNTGPNLEKLSTVIKWTEDENPFKNSFRKLSSVVGSKLSTSARPTRIGERIDPRYLFKSPWWTTERTYSWSDTINILRKRNASDPSDRKAEEAALVFATRGNEGFYLPLTEAYIADYQADNHGLKFGSNIVLYLGKTDQEIREALDALDSHRDPGLVNTGAITGLNRFQDSTPDFAGSPTWDKFRFVRPKKTIKGELVLESFKPSDEEYAILSSNSPKNFH